MILRQIDEMHDGSVKNTIKIFLEGDFTTLNEYILAERGHFTKAAKIKKNETYRVAYDAHGIQPPTEYPVDVSFFWHCKNTNTDPDNIAFACKFLFDGLVKAGVLAGDGWKHIRSISHGFGVDKDNVGTEVTITW